MERRVGSDQDELAGESDGDAGRNALGAQLPTIMDQGKGEENEAEQGGYLDPREVPDPDPPIVGRHERQRRYEHQKRGQDYDRGGDQLHLLEHDPADPARAGPFR